MAKAKVLKAWGSNRPGDIVEIDDRYMAAYVRKGLVLAKEFMGVTSSPEPEAEPASKPRRRRARRKKV